MKHLSCFASLLILAASVYGADFSEKSVTYTLGDETFQSTIVWESDEEDHMPGILMVPNWMGPTEASLKKARSVAEEGFVVMMVDMYGVDTRPENSKEASAAAGAVRSDRDLMRARAMKALLEFRAAEGIPLEDDRIAAIGFCFGGGTVLELGRAGAGVDAVISFHGDLLSPTLEADAGNTRAKVLVLHGADDPYVPQDHVATFIAAMRETDVDWQLIQFGNTVHSFTDPLADAKGQADYHPESAERAFEYMEELLEEIWEEED